MSYSDRLEGVGGWLAFFLVTLGVFTPLATLVNVLGSIYDPNVAGAYGDTFSAIIATEVTLTVLTIGFCWFAVFRFLRVRTWRTVHIGIAALWFLCLSSVVLEPLAISAIAGFDLGQIYGAFGVGLIKPFIYSGIWTAYLLNSERVSNTYRYPQGDADGIAEVFE
jgi:hypothetical protein